MAPIDPIPSAVSETPAVSEIPPAAETSAVPETPPTAKTPAVSKTPAVPESPSPLFTGFPAEGLDLLIQNRLHNDRAFYEACKPRLKALVLEPFYRLCEAMTPVLSAIDPSFVTVPRRMVSRIRRDTRFTKDKTLYRANLWLFFRRPRPEGKNPPFFYFELAPDFWRYGCWGIWTPSERETARQMVLQEDAVFREAYQAVQRCPALHLVGERYKRPKYPDAPAVCQPWLNAKELGIEYQETADFAPLRDGSFVAPMLEHMQQLAPFYRFLLTVHLQTNRTSNQVSI